MDYEAKDYPPQRTPRIDPRTGPDVHDTYAAQAAHAARAAAKVAGDAAIAAGLHAQTAAYGGVYEDGDDAVAARAEQTPVIFPHVPSGMESFLMRYVALERRVNGLLELLELHGKYAHGLEARIAELERATSPAGVDSALTALLADHNY